MFWNAMMLALREIRRNVLRSSLTILGIVIGVAAVITMVTIGEGATAQVQADIQKLGTNLLQVFRGQGFGGGGGARSAAPPFTMDDVRAIENEISGVRAVAPSSNTQAQAIYGNSNWSTQVTGTSDKYLEVRDWPLASGRNFSEIRAARRRRGLPARRHGASRSCSATGSDRRRASGSASCRAR